MLQCPSPFSFILYEHAPVRSRAYFCQVPASCKKETEKKKKKKNSEEKGEKKNGTERHGVDEPVTPGCTAQMARLFTCQLSHARSVKKINQYYLDIVRIALFPAAV